METHGGRSRPMRTGSDRIEQPEDRQQRQCQVNWVYWHYTSHANTYRGSVSAWGPGFSPMVAAKKSTGGWLPWWGSTAGRARTLEKILLHTVSQWVIVGASIFTSHKKWIWNNIMNQMVIIPSHPCICACSHFQDKSGFDFTEGTIQE